MRLIGLLGVVLMSRVSGACDLSNLTFVDPTSGQPLDLDPPLTPGTTVYNVGLPPASVLTEVVFSASANCSFSFSLDGAAPTKVPTGAAHDIVLHLPEAPLYHALRLSLNGVAFVVGFLRPTFACDLTNLLTTQGLGILTPSFAPSVFEYNLTTASPSLHLTAWTQPSCTVTLGSSTGVGSKTITVVPPPGGAPVNLAVTFAPAGPFNYSVLVTRVPTGLRQVTATPGVVLSTSMIVTGASAIQVTVASLCSVCDLVAEVASNDQNISTGQVGLAFPLPLAAGVPGEATRLQVSTRYGHEAYLDTTSVTVQRVNLQLTALKLMQNAVSPPFSPKVFNYAAIVQDEGDILFVSAANGAQATTTVLDTTTGSLIPSSNGNVTMPAAVPPSFVFAQYFIETSVPGETSALASTVLLTLHAAAFVLDSFALSGASFEPPFAWNTFAYTISHVDGGHGVVRLIAATLLNTSRVLVNNVMYPADRINLTISLRLEMAFNVTVVDAMQTNHTTYTFVLAREPAHESSALGAGVGGTLGLILVVAFGVVVFRWQRGGLPRDRGRDEYRPLLIRKASVGTGSTGGNASAPPSGPRGVGLGRVDVETARAALALPTSAYAQALAVRFTRLQAQYQRLEAGGTSEAIVQQFNGLAESSKSSAASIGRQRINAAKNRVPSIVPFDNFRVPLVTATSSDYINASFVGGHDHDQRYIATQGPMPGTAEDFCRLLWERSASTVVMLSDFGDGQSVDYVPVPGASIALGAFMVTQAGASATSLVAGESGCTLFIRPHVESGGSLAPAARVPHFRLTQEWTHPDDLPTDLDALVGLAANLVGAPSPIVVHCPTGSSRTALFIVIHRFLEFLHDPVAVTNNTPPYHLPECIRQMRRSRPGMISSPGQLAVAYQGMSKALQLVLSTRAEGP